MANLTIAVDDDVLRRARIRALEAGTSVNALLRSYLETFVGDESMAKRRHIVEQAALAQTVVGPATWSRGDLHDRQLMGVRAFIDTNVLVYLHDSGNGEKQQRAQELLLNDDYDLVISAQVLNEFFVTVTRKIAVPMSGEQATSAVEALAELEVVPITRNLVVDALRTGARHQLSHWDSLIVEAASRSGCSQLVTEDLAAGSILRGVTVVNPFLADQL